MKISKNLEENMKLNDHRYRHSIKKSQQNAGLSHNGRLTNEDTLCPSVHKYRKNKYLTINLGDVIWDRYKVFAILGEGAFGRVLKAIDLSTNAAVALKIMKHKKNHWEKEISEITILRTLGDADPDGKHLCVKMLNSFDFYGHTCIVFELLGSSVFQFMKGNNYKPYPIDQVRHIAYQLCYSVKFIHDNHIIHGDLKPDNIVFVNSGSGVKNKETRKVLNTDIRIIDFGSAIFDHEPNNFQITTQPYRAPEVFLELGWDQLCDIWSIGCILFELYFGKLLFAAFDQKKHLAMMEHILGPLPFDMTKKSKSEFISNGRFNWDYESAAACSVKRYCQPLETYIGPDLDGHCLVHLISEMLQYEPSRRISARKALEHPFFYKLPPELKFPSVEEKRKTGWNRLFDCSIVHVLDRVYSLFT